MACWKILDLGTIAAHVVYPMPTPLLLLDDTDLDAIQARWISVVLFAREDDTRAKYAEQAIETLRDALVDGKLEPFLMFGRVDVRSSATRLLTSSADVKTLAVVVFRLGRLCETFETQSHIKQGLAPERFRTVYQVE